MKKAIAVVIVATLLIAGFLGAYRYSQFNPDLVHQARQRLGLSLIPSMARQAGPLAASGIVEVRTVAVSSDLGGRISALHVAEGDEVFEGQPLATVEAMKMEKILRAERKGVVTTIKASAGSSLAVDDVIMEFE
jgi:biotin carboxyl carrier protein